MAWTVDTIEKDWIGGKITALALPTVDILAAFSRVEALLGTPWINQAHFLNGAVVTGTAPTLRIVSMGQRLAALDGIHGADKLIGKIREGGASAEAELTAIYLVRRTLDVQIELEPEVGRRRADFRARCGDSDWVFAEVTFPDWSEATERARAVLSGITSVISQIKSSFALEVLLRREPDGNEIERILDLIPSFCAQGGVCRKDLERDLGALFLNHSSPGQVVTDDHGEEARPRLGVARAMGGGTEPHRHVSVRMAYSDQRADAFLTSEARQLPKDSPGLIMIGVSRAPGAIKTWEPLPQKRLQPTMHTRVSGICLFGGGLLLTDKGEAWLAETKLLSNPHAALALPDWVQQNLIEAGEEFTRVNKPHTS